MTYDEQYDRLVEAYDLSEYYSQMTGRGVVFGVSASNEIWVRSGRTNDYEYFNDFNEAEQRVKQLYSDILPDDGDYSDPYEGI